MNRLIFIIFSLLLMLTSLQAQTADCPTCPPNGDSDQSEYDVIKTKNMMYEGEFVPGEILIKYKDEVTQVLGKSNKGTVITGIRAIDAIFEKHQITEAKKLFPQAERLLQKQILKSFNGYEFERPSLHNIHKLKISEEAKEINIYEAIEELKQIPEVEYAEPNYIFAIVEDEALSPELSEEEMLEWLETNSNQKINKSTNSNVVVPNDPLYNQQWGIPATQVDLVWDTTTGDTTQIIAILDTGVDWLHPDLKNKIWRNKDEIADNGIDDDGNGLIDDIRGWDYINNDNNPTDDNSHGTHVAGIAAAESNNGIGIAGVNWKSKILPLKVFQSSGRGDAATITKAIIYASQKGATVINMSFGTYSKSLTMETALANAYANTILVAAAGNDAIPIGPGFRSKIFYPAGISYVLGIEASGEGAGFSNYDQDGPVFSKYEELNNYELQAPGANIISLVPNGGYRIYNGTSMATPLVSGAVAIYRNLFPEQSQELLWGNLINKINEHIKLFDAINAEPKPELWFVSNSIVDTLDGDSDGRVDAGETIELLIEVRNTWGQADSVYVGLKLGDFEDKTSAAIEKDKAFIGSISPYARRTNEFEPLKILINSNVAHNRDIVFESLLWFEGANDTIKQEIILNIENGEEISGIMDSNLVLGPDKLWLFNDSFRNAGNLTILPGTKIILNSTIDNRGNIFAKGTRDSVIEIIGPNSITGYGKAIFEYVLFSDINYPIGKMGQGSMKFDNCSFINMNTIDAYFTEGLFSSYQLNLTNCEIKNSILKQIFAIAYDTLIVAYNNFDNILFSNLTPSQSYSNEDIKHNNFANFADYNFILFGADTYSRVFMINDMSLTMKMNNIFSPSLKHIYFLKADGGSNIINSSNQYWGTLNKPKMNSVIFDFWEDSSLPMIEYNPFLTSPSDSAHGVVWKVLVDGIDPQDEHLDPIGVGTHRFDVYFNRSMDTDYIPNLSFGVREPFTQQAVTDSSFWSADSMIWTAYKTIQLHTGDGINRIRVADARDTEDFEIITEDMRFEFVIDAAGLSSTDFNATAGLGKIELDWKQPEDVIDLLGYNIYRFTNITDTTYSDTLLINIELITDSTYTDYDVVPGNNYYYQYSVVKTDFNESDLSKVVGTQALTSSPGDANGDLAVNVLDITSIVSYLLNENPQPFIFEAADVDTNGVINVLDIVKSINIIMGVTTPNLAAKEQSAELAVHGNSIRIKEGEEISGIEFKVIGEGIENADIIGGALLAGMEYSHSYNKDTLKVLVYNFKNKPFNAKDGELLKLSKGKIISVDEIAAGDMNGNVVNINGGSSEVMIPDNYILYQNYPNPFNPTTTIRYGLTKSKDVEIIIYNILGQRIKTFTMNNQMAGYHEVQWNSTNNNGYKVATGVYIYQIKAGNFITQKKMLLLK